MGQKKKVFLVVTLLVLFLIGWQVYLYVNKENTTPEANVETENNNKEPLEEYPDVGGLAPDFELEDVKGNILSLKSFRGKPLLLVFWTTECPYCIQELQFLKENYDTIEKTFEIVAVNITAGEKSPSFVKEYVQNEEYPFTVLLDIEADTYRKYLVRGIPTTFIIDSKGKIVEKKLGAFGPGYLEQFENIE